MFVEVLVTYIIVLAGIWFLTEVLQGIWYESVVGHLVPRVLLAAAILTALQVYLRIRLETLMDASLPWVIVSGIVWAVVFYVAFQFSAGHALGLGVGGMLLLTCLSGMVSDGFRGIGAGPASSTAARNRTPLKTYRSTRPGSGFMPFQVPTIESRGQAPSAPAQNASGTAQPPSGADGAIKSNPPASSPAKPQNASQPANSKSSTPQPAP